jgi:hypothetical protein
MVQMRDRVYAEFICTEMQEAGGEEKSLVEAVSIKEFSDSQHFHPFFLDSTAPGILSGGRPVNPSHEHEW